MSAFEAPRSPARRRARGGRRGPPTGELPRPALAEAAPGAVVYQRNFGRRDRGRVLGEPTAAPLPAVREDDPALTLGAARASGSFAKRGLDIVGALLGLLFLAPLLALTALLVRLESPGPALFRQWRTGKGGKPFRIYKFRTMRLDEADERASVVQASRGDCRVTRLGSFLRQSCFDELPQLLNVLRGEMSLVGPRPHAVAHDRYYDARIEDYGRRFLVRPGITGLAQVSGFRGETKRLEEMEGRIALDLEYARRWSLGLDLTILVRTAFEGPFHPAAY